MARYKMTGACPIKIGDRMIQPDAEDFDADLSEKELAWFTQIQAIAVVSPDPKPEEKKWFKPLSGPEEEG